MATEGRHSSPMRWVTMRAIAYGLLGALLLVACSAEEGTDGTEVPGSTTADGQSSNTGSPGSTPPGRLRTREPQKEKTRR